MLLMFFDCYSYFYASKICFIILVCVCVCVCVYYYEYLYVFYNIMLDIGERAIALMFPV